MIRKKSTRLFLGKWTHQIIFQFDGAFMAGKYRKNALKFSIVNTKTLNGIRRFVNTTDDFLNYADKIKLGGNRIYMYFNDASILDKLDKKSYEYVYQITSPENKLIADFISSNKKYIICKKLPHDGKYQFKITLKSNISSDDRSILLNWLLNYPSEQYLLTPATKRWLQSQRIYLSVPYFYVKDSAMVTLASMVLSNSVVKIEEYILKSDISAVMTP
jgi:hypothetical protein